VPRHRTVTRVALTQKITVPLLHPRHVKCKLILGPEINRIISDLQQGHGFGGFPLGVCEVICQCDGRDHRVEIWLSYQRRTARRPGETIPHHTTPHHTTPHQSVGCRAKAFPGDQRRYQELPDGSGASLTTSLVPHDHDPFRGLVPRQIIHEAPLGQGAPFAQVTKSRRRLGPYTIFDSRREQR
jgi:hypothetical protein